MTDTTSNSSTAQECIGIYAISSSEEDELVEDRLYHRLALLTPEGWTSSSDPLIISTAPEEKTIDSFQSEFNRDDLESILTSTLSVECYTQFADRPDNVLGETEITEPKYDVDELFPELDVIMTEKAYRNI